MRRLIAISLPAFGLALALAAGTARAQDDGIAWNPRSGDAWVDAWLGDMNRYGARYRDPFIDELVRYHNAPRELVLDLLTRRRWAPGDVYFACALAKRAGRPCRHVVDLWERDHERGWGTVAKQLGIRPGSPEFQRIKRDMVPSYDRWGRPISLDAQLARDLPERGKGAKPGAGPPARDQNAPPPGKARSDGSGRGKGKDKD